VCVLYSWHKMFGLIALRILMGNPCISFGKCHLFSYLSICGWGFTMCYIVFRVWNATFICFFNEFYNFLFFLNTVCESGLFDFLVFWVSVFLCLCWLECLVLKFTLYCGIFAQGKNCCWRADLQTQPLLGNRFVTGDNVVTWKRCSLRGPCGSYVMQE
jgi:hypothetical protein